MDIKIIHKLDTFFAQFALSKFEKGNSLIEPGQKPRGIYYLLKGNVRQYSIDKNGEVVTFHIYKPHTFFPMAWAVNSDPNAYYFENINYCELRIAPKEAVVEFVKKEPEILFDLLQRVYIGLDGILTRLQQNMSGDAGQKLLTILIILAKRFGKNEKDGILIKLELTHQDLASLAGLSRETVSRGMMKLKDKRIVNYTNTAISVRSIQDLEKELVR